MRGALECYLLQQKGTDAVQIATGKRDGLGEAAHVKGRSPWPCSDKVIAPQVKVPYVYLSDEVRQYRARTRALLILATHTDFRS
jgi:hypothetical protein